MNFLLVVGFISTDGSMTNNDIANYVAANVQDTISRTSGVGDFTLFGAQYAMRIWIDTAKLNNYALTAVDVSAAIEATDVQNSYGPLGAPPAKHGQTRKKGGEGKEDA